MRVDYAIHICTICTNADITVGNQKFGGVRYCAGCLPNTFLWKQCNIKDQIAIVATLNRLRERKDVRKDISKLRKGNTRKNREDYIQVERVWREQPGDDGTTDNN